MRKVIALVLFIGIVAALVLPVLGVSAQTATARTVTVTEAQINASYRVTNPFRRAVSNVSVDLQPGVAVISSTHTYRSRGQDQVYACSSIWSPSVTNGIITWTLNSATCNGQPASQNLISQINASIGSSWRNYWRMQRGGRAQSVTITDSEINIVVG